MSNSNLVSYAKISPNKTSPRNHAIDTITIHCMAGNLSVEQCGNVFASKDRKASSNYGVGSDGRIGMYVEEKDRSWCSSNAANDNRAITIEVANDGGADTGWHVSDKAYKALIDLLVDICQRNGIKALLWKGNKALVGQVSLQNMTVHRWFAAKACPGDYLYNKHGDIANAVNERLNKKQTKIQNEIDTIDRPRYIWDRLKSAGFSDIANAAVLGNLYDESHFRPNNLQNSYEKKFGMDDETYTALVNSKTYGETSFATDGSGYGIAQWTYWTRKQNLYDYTIKQGYNIDALPRQVDFLISEFKDKYKLLFNAINSSKSISEASKLVLTQYERPADQGSSVQKRRAEYAQLYYNKFSGKEVYSIPFLAKISRDDLNIRTGPGSKYESVGYTGKGTFTIVEVSGNWGLLKSYSKKKDGWICLDYIERA